MQIFQLHYTNLDGYAFPLVAKVIDQISVPSILAQIPEPYLGDLRVSLAHELSVVVKMAVYEMRQEHTEQSHHLAAVEACMDRRYHAASVKHRKWNRREEDEYNKLIEFEKRAYYNGCAITQASKAERCKPRSPVNPRFGWRVDHPGLIKLELLQKQHVKLIKHYQATRSALARADKRATAEQNRFFNSPQYKTKLAELRQRELLFTLGAGSEFQLSGAAYFLKNLDFDWWDSFAKSVTDTVRETIARGVHRIALRDPNVVEEIELLKSASKSWDDAAETLFNDPSNDWAVPAIKADAIRQMRARLRQEDRKGEEWIIKHGGRDHPCNVYFSWGRRHGICAPPDGALGGGIGRKFRNIYEALNELCWCLARKDDVLLDFKPVTHHGYSREDWESHRKQWWAQIERAKDAARPM